MQNKDERTVKFVHNFFPREMARGVIKKNLISIFSLLELLKRKFFRFVISPLARLLFRCFILFQLNLQDNLDRVGVSRAYFHHEQILFQDIHYNQKIVKFR